MWMCPFTLRLRSLALSSSLSSSITCASSIPSDPAILLLIFCLQIYKCSFAWAQANRSSKYVQREYSNGPELIKPSSYFIEFIVKKKRAHTHSRTRTSIHINEAIQHEIDLGIIGNKECAPRVCAPKKNPN